MTLSVNTDAPQGEVMPQVAEFMHQVADMPLQCTGVILNDKTMSATIVGQDMRIFLIFELLADQEPGFSVTTIDAEYAGNSLRWAAGVTTPKPFGEGAELDATVNEFFLRLFALAASKFIVCN